MKILGVKKYIFTIWVLLSTLVFSAVGLAVTNILNDKNNPAPKNVEVAAADLTISNLSQLQVFANNVNKGNNYSGKTVVLDSDIDCGGASFYSIGTNEDNLYKSADAVIPFAGTFNGNGHIIYNFTIDDIFPHYYGGTAGELYGCGFFAALDKGAQVLNLGLKDYRINSLYDIYSATTISYSGSTIGGIAGFLAMDGSGQVNINNCVIDGLTVNCSSDTGVFAVGGILGGNPHIGATIENCLINSISITVTGTGAFSDANIGGIVGNDPSTGSTIVKVSKCIVNKDNWVCNCHTDYSTICTFTSQNTSYCYNVAKTTTGLSWSSAGGNYNASATNGTQTTWYYAEAYKSGWPMLRVFMKNWKTVTFTAVNGTVSPTSIQIPSDANKTYSSTTETITIYDQTITAKPKDSSYKSPTWTCNSVTSYTVTFVQETFNIYFTLATNTKAYYSVNGGAFNEITSYYYQMVTSSTKVNMTYEQYSKRNCFSACEFKFTNLTGDSIVVKYEIENKSYFIKGYDYKLKDTTKYVGVGLTIDSFEIGTYREFRVTTELKTYDSNFQ